MRADRKKRPVETWWEKGIALGFCLHIQCQATIINSLNTDLGRDIHSWVLWAHGNTPQHGINHRPHILIVAENWLKMHMVVLHFHDHYILPTKWMDYCHHDLGIRTLFRKCYLILSPMVWGQGNLRHLGSMNNVIIMKGPEGMLKSFVYGSNRNTSRMEQQNV